MNALTTLESRLADLYAKLPNLPIAGRRWLAASAWWIVLVFAIISSIFLLVAIPSLFTILGLSAYAGLYTYSTVSVGQLFASALVNIFFSIISVILLWTAFTPLRAMRRLGWQLLFVNQLVAVVAAIVSFFVLIQNVNIFGLLGGLIVAAIELYFVFQIRDEFALRRSKTVKTSVTEKTARPAKTVKPVAEKE